MEKEEVMEPMECEDAATQDMPIGAGNLAVDNGNGSSASPTREGVSRQNDDLVIHQNPAESANSFVPRELSVVLGRAETDKAMAKRRLTRELGQLSIMLPEGCQVMPVGDDLFKWMGTLTGPKDTPYEGGTYKISLHFPHKFPFAPPQVTFLTAIYHCNVSVEGNVGQEALDKIWNPAMTVFHMLLSLRKLLVEPVLEDATMSSFAEMYKTNKNLHDAYARVLAMLYAHPLPT